MKARFLSILSERRWIDGLALTFGGLVVFLAYVVTQ